MKPPGAGILERRRPRCGSGSASPCMINDLPPSREHPCCLINLIPRGRRNAAAGYRTSSGLAIKPKRAHSGVRSEVVVSRIAGLAERPAALAPDARSNTDRGS
jgi:hypothetical protein